MSAEVSEDAHRQVASDSPETSPLSVGDTPKGVGTPSLSTSSGITPDSAISVTLPEDIPDGGESSSIDKDAKTPGAVVKERLEGDVSAVPETKSADEDDEKPSGERRKRDFQSSAEEEASDGTDVNNWDVDYYAKRLRSKDLYRIYRSRLAKRQEKRAPKDAEASDDGDHACRVAKQQAKPAAKDAEPPDQGHLLVTSLIDYLRVLEERVAKLEKENAEPANAEPANAEPANAEPANAEPANANAEPANAEPASTKSAEAEKKDDEPSGVPYSDGAGDEVLTSFHDYRTEHNLVFNGDNPRSEGLFTKGEESFVDRNQKYVLRVLFKWNMKQEKEELRDILSQPDPCQIEILGIRINSEPIARYLDNIVGFKLDSESITHMSKPFRLLIRNAATIREQLDSLEQRYNPATPQRASSVVASNDTQESADDTATSKSQSPQKEEPETGGEPVKGPAEPPYESKAALLHFRELVHFMDKYLSRKHELFTKFRTGAPTKVNFEDLWMLFDSGDIVLCLKRRGGDVIDAGEDSDDEKHISVQRYVPQAYRVISSQGGIPSAVGGLFPSPSPADSGEQVMRGVNRSAGATSQQNLDGIMGEQQSGDKARARFTPLQVYCYFVDYDGRQLSAVPEIFEIKPFDGEVEVATLAVFPASYQKSLGRKQIERSEYLRARGRRFLDYTRVAHLEYDGLTVGEIREDITSPVMVDFALAFKENPTLVPKCFGLDAPFWKAQVPAVWEIPLSTCNDPNMSCCVSEVYNKQEKHRNGGILSKLRDRLEGLYLSGDKQLKRLRDVGDDLVMLLPGVVHGFSLHSRKWLQFDMDYLKAVNIKKGASGWDDLVLPDAHRTMVQSMVETHTRQTSSKTSGEGKYDMGLVPGKGKGCIILLHGVPGVGKTSTAECVAAYTERPLFPITSGDIGYEPIDVEEKLEKLFRLAHKWGCVLLIDEADVFLAERDKSDVKRNGLVSVFLRVLEYYSGILFLTTNRVGSLDEAFRSRVHLALYYPKLSPEFSYQVWKMNIKRIEKLNKGRKKGKLLPVAYEKKEILRWAKTNYEALSWNGRQIQNAFHTALALAEFEVRNDKPGEERQPTITMDHFETIGGATIEFERYLVETHAGADASTKSKKQQLRSDKFKTEAKVALPGRELVKPVARKPKPKSKSKRKAETSSSESESDESASEEEEDASTGESEESSDNEKTRKKEKAKRKGTGKAKPETNEKDKTKDGRKKGTKSKKGTKEEDTDDSDEEAEEEELSDEEKARKKNKKKTSKTKGKKNKSSGEEDSNAEDGDKKSSKTKGKKKQRSEDEDIDEYEKEEEDK